MRFTKKMYALIEKAALQKPVNLPADWLLKLAQKCGELLVLSDHDTLLLAQSFKKHAGAGSTYNAKKSLVDNLQYLYQLVFSKEKRDDAIAIATKLKEDAQECTPGFHNRVIAAIDGYLRPINLHGLLEQIRVDIVEATASQNTGEVHAHNRFYTVAEAQGYGIRARNRMDRYIGALDVPLIKQRLNDAFENRYNSLGLFVQLSDAIKSTLHFKFGYTGPKEIANDYAEEESRRYGRKRACALIGHDKYGLKNGRTGHQGFFQLSLRARHG